MADPFNPEEIDRLRRLRERFLGFEERTPGRPVSYWRDEADLALYDATFAARIGWKWDAVLHELSVRGRLRRARTVLDWGSGTGIAVRRYLAAAGPETVESVFVFDRDSQARDYSARMVKESHPALAVTAGLPGDPPGLLLLSHVLDELDVPATAALLDLVRRTSAVIWVEPGSRATSRRLSGFRDALRAEFEVLAPCTHDAPCGVLAAGRDEDWCHFFAAPPPEAFTEGRWTRFGRALGIDLRSLPYSFVALAKPGPTGPAAGPAARLLGRPRPSRGRVDLTVCDAGGLHDLHLLQRTDKTLFKSLASSPAAPALFDLTTEGDRILSIRGDDV